MVSDVMAIRRIISGGQTGVDRAALDVALERGIECGGWCPQGRRAEDGTIDGRYPLDETDSRRYALRTELNVRDADGTLVVTVGEPTGGTAFTLKAAEKHGRPSLLLDPTEKGAVEAFHEWVKREKIETLNVAGPRESNMPGIYVVTAFFLHKVLQ